MAAYLVSWVRREDIQDLSTSEREELTPHKTRISASNATRAISKLTNELKNDECIFSKGEIIILEAKVTA